MSRKNRNRKPARRPGQALLFAAMGDATRIALVGRLATGSPSSIAQLASGSRLTRQAITKHLRVLERAGLVRSRRCGRENLFELDPQPIAAMKDYLDAVSHAWDEALGRLKAFVES
jgi:DNA-binding transcriptional ArsR family regulator